MTNLQWKEAYDKAKARFNYSNRYEEWTEALETRAVAYATEEANADLFYNLKSERIREENSAW